jgi:hypothetical protein
MAQPEAHGLDDDVLDGSILLGRSDFQRSVESTIAEINGYLCCSQVACRIHASPHFRDCSLVRA